MCESNSLYYLSYSVSLLLNSILIYSDSEVKLFNLKTYQYAILSLLIDRVVETFQSASRIQSADIFNETIVLSTDANQLLLLNAYDLSQPICSYPVVSSISAVRFFQPTQTPQPIEKTPSPVLERRRSYVSPSSTVDESQDSILEAANRIHQSVDKIASKQSTVIEKATSVMSSQDSVEHVMKSVFFFCVSL